jgi:hypothetical protein
MRLAPVKLGAENDDGDLLDNSIDGFAVIDNS